MLAVKFSKYMRCPFVPTSLSKMQWLHTLLTSRQNIFCCSTVWDSCVVLLFPAVCHTICIFLTLVSAYSPTLLTPLPQSIPYKSLPQAAISTNIIPHALPCSRKAKETAAYTGADLQGKQEGNGGREGGVGLNGEALSGRMGRGYSLGREPIQLQAVVQPWFLWRHKIHISTVSSSLP